VCRDREHSSGRLVKKSGKGVEQLAQSREISQLQRSLHVNGGSQQHSNYTCILCYRTYSLASHCRGASAVPALRNEKRLVAVANHGLDEKCQEFVVHQGRLDHYLASGCADGWSSDLLEGASEIG
jgi:hypothetical protein